MLSTSTPAVPRDAKVAARCGKVRQGTPRLRQGARQAQPRIHHERAVALSTQGLRASYPALQVRAARGSLVRARRELRCACSPNY